MSRLTKTILIIGLILLIYGYLCRQFQIGFFWDSKTIGLIILFITLLSYWIDLRRTRSQKGKKTLWVTIGICILIFGLIVMPVVVFMLKTSDAYATAIEYLKTDPKIKDEIGNVKGFGLIPTGSVGTTTINGAESGSASFEITVQGNNKNKDVTIHLEKTPDKSWTVTDIR
ncbi:MAG: hypothetical protein ACHQFX_03810 [Chitinophagales bacterium]